MQRRNVLGQQAQEIVAHRLGNIRQGQTRSHVGDYTEFAAQVVRRFAPQFRALALQFTHLFQGFFQISYVSRGLDLLHFEILIRTVAHTFAANARQRPVGGRQYGRLEIRMRARIVVQFIGQTQLKVGPLARHFLQVVALLPAMQAMRGSVFF